MLSHRFTLHYGAGAQRMTSVVTNESLSSQFSGTEVNTFAAHPEQPGWTVISSELKLQINMFTFGLGDTLEKWSVCCVQSIQSMSMVELND